MICDDCHWCYHVCDYGETGCLRDVVRRCLNSRVDVYNIDDEDIDEDCSQYLMSTSTSYWPNSNGFVVNPDGTTYKG